MLCCVTEKQGFLPNNDSVPHPDHADLSDPGAAVTMEMGADGRATRKSSSPPLARTRSKTSTSTSTSEKKIDEIELERWLIQRADKEEKFRREEKNHPMTLSFLLRGKLVALDREMADEPHAASRVSVPHLKGDWAGEVVISVFKTYSSDKGLMDYYKWLDFMSDIDLCLTHLPPKSDREILNPAFLWRKVLDLSPDELYTGINNKVITANFPQFYTLLLVLCQRVYAKIFDESATNAMELFLHEVIVPVYYFHLGDQPHEKCASQDELVKDGRILLLLSAYLPNLWRLFLHYAQDLANRLPATYDENNLSVKGFGTHKPLPEELKFPNIPQLSERSLFAGVTHLPALTGEERKNNQGLKHDGQVRVCEERGVRGAKRCARSEAMCEERSDVRGAKRCARSEATSRKGVSTGYQCTCLIFGNM